MILKLDCNFSLFYFKVISEYTKCMLFYQYNRYHNWKKNPWSSLCMFTPPMDFDIFNENQMLRYKGFSLYINLIQFYKSVPISSIIIRWLFYNNFHFHFCIFPCFDITVWHNSCDICHANVQYYSRTNFAPLHYGL